MFELQLRHLQRKGCEEEQGWGERQGEEREECCASSGWNWSQGGSSTGHYLFIVAPKMKCPVGNFFQQALPQGQKGKSSTVANQPAKVKEEKKKDVFRGRCSKGTWRRIFEATGEFCYHKGK